MPRLSSCAAIRARIEAIRADRARGLTFTEIGKVHGVCGPLAHRYAHDVDIAHLWRRWHLARWCKPDPPNLTVRQVHELRGGSWGAP